MIAATMTSPMKRLPTLALAMALVLTMASAAWAVRIFGATNPDNQMGTVQSLLDLGADIGDNDIGNTLAFDLKEDGAVIITFTAECAVDGTEQQWVSIELLVNGDALRPSRGDQDTFCSGNGFARVQRRVGDGQHDRPGGGRCRQLRPADPGDALRGGRRVVDRRPGAYGPRPETLTRAAA